MMTRPFIILLAGTLLSAATAHADRKKRNREDDEEVVTKRSIGGEDRRRAAKSIEEDDDQEEEATPKKKKKKTAQAPGEVVDSDGPEAVGIVPIRLDDLIEVAVRHAPNLARAKLEREAARGDAGAARIDHAWVLKGKASYTQFGRAGDAEVDLLETVKEEKVDGTLGLGRKLPTGGELSLEVSFNRTLKEIAITKELINAVDPNTKVEQNVDEFTTTHQTTAQVTFTQPLLR